MQKALASLPWVDQGSVKASVVTKRVQLVVKDAAAYDEAALIDALKKQDFDEVRVLARGT